MTNCSHSDIIRKISGKAAGQMFIGYIKINRTVMYFSHVGRAAFSSKDIG